MTPRTRQIKFAPWKKSVDLEASMAMILINGFGACLIFYTLLLFGTTDMSSDLSRPSSCMQELFTLCLT